MKYFLFTFLACCSAISIGYAGELSHAADLFCKLANRFESASTKSQPLKINGFDCTTFCKRNKISVNITIQCDVGRKPANKKLVKLASSMAKQYAKFFSNLACDPVVHINVNSKNSKNTVEITGVC